MRGGGTIEHRSGARAGMTLVEMLIVLVIVGVCAGMVVLSIGGRSEASAQVEANRLAERLRLAADDVLVDGQPVTLRMTGTSYELAGAASDDGRYDLPRGVRLSGESDTVVVDPDGATPPSRINVRDRDHLWTVDFDGLNAVARPVAEGRG
ncbi:prepilin-type N-terminal cleavage/methylation domain-containing protein [Brevundimonas sp. NPDC092305]|uniref:prepilin-type N-terminal cleavage/methylation domain-containing protein n=1 Tax=Brevundimonas sp. NPDC092305 TaxID=3363957 RepID=UPI0038301611